MAMRKDSLWRDGFLGAIERGALSEAIAVLDGEKTAHAGTPRQAVKLEAVKVMREALWGGDICEVRGGNGVCQFGK